MFTLSIVASTHWSCSPSIILIAEVLLRPPFSFHPPHTRKGTDLPIRLSSQSTWSLLLFRTCSALSSVLLPTCDNSPLPRDRLRIRTSRAFHIRHNQQSVPNTTPAKNTSKISKAGLSIKSCSQSHHGFREAQAVRLGWARQRAV